MNTNFIIDYPWWFVVLCLLAGVAASAILYYKNTSGDLTQWQKRALSVFRFLVVAILCFLLLSPLLYREINKPQDPLILVFQDNSESLITGRYAGYMQTSYLEDFYGFVEDLSSDHQVIAYGFGEQVREMDTFDFQDKLTDMSEIFSSLEVLYRNRNVGAVIIASDGIYNRGQNPLYQPSSGLFPVYTLALGDTVPQRDLLINRLQHNRITYLNNLFPLEVTLEARQAKGKNSMLRVYHEEEMVFEQNISFTSDNHFETISLELEAQEVGIKRYRVELEAIEDEITLANNQQDFFIEVIDSRQKVVIMNAAPHPDVGAIKFALEDNENFEAEVWLWNEFEGDIRDYDLVIWHQLPSNRHTVRQLISQATEASMPQLYFIGSQSSISAFNRLQTGIQIQVRSAGFNDARAEFNNDFTLFQLPRETRELMLLWPPLQSPFANYTLSPATQVMAFQRIGAVTSDYPLITFTETADQKTAVIAGEGIWRWRINTFARNANHDAFNDLISRIIQYLSVVEDKSFFRVTTQNFLYENQPAIFEAELYNRSYEPVNDPDVHLTVINEEGVEFDYIFGRTTHTYSLNAGTFPPGEYRYEAHVTFGQDQYEAQGIFTVSPLNIEGINTLANHQLLFQLADNTTGEMFFPNQMDELLHEIQNRNDIVPVVHTQKEYEDLLNLRWIFFVLLFLLATEWFIRKYSGSY